jgi:hypothetical protein
VFHQSLLSILLYAFFGSDAFIAFTLRLLLVSISALISGKKVFVRLTSNSLTGKCPNCHASFIASPPCAWKFAPLSMRNWTTSSSPLTAATCNVVPYCQFRTSRSAPLLTSKCTTVRTKLTCELLCCLLLHYQSDIRRSRYDDLLQHHDDHDSQPHLRRCGVTIVQSRGFRDE